MTRRLCMVLVFATIGIVVSLVFFGSSNDSKLEEAVQRHRLRTLPPDGTSTSPEIRREDWRTIAQWTIKTKLTWKEYKAWLTTRFEGDYRLVSEGKMRVMFKQVRHDEIHEISVRMDQTNAIIHVSYSLSPW